MRLRALIVTTLGLALAAGSVVVAHRVLQNANQQSAEPAAAPVEVANLVVARSAINFGQEIEPEMLETQEWPAKLVPEGAFTTTEAVLGNAQIGTRRAKRSIGPGELILTSKVSNFGEKVTIVQTLCATCRATAIKVDAVSGVGGFVTPGDKVDVVMIQRRNDTMRARTILQDIRVIGTDQLADEDSDKPQVARTVTVEVEPEESQKLALAQQAGSLTLTLRNLEETEELALVETTLQDLVPEKDDRPVIRVRPSVTINRAGQASRETVSN